MAEYTGPVVAMQVPCSGETGIGPVVAMQVPCPGETGMVARVGQTKQSLTQVLVHHQFVLILALWQCSAGHSILPNFLLDCSKC